MHQRRQHQFSLDTEVTDTDLAELLREALVDVPVAARLPSRVHRGRQRMDEGMHVAGVEVVLLVPGGGGQHDVGVQTGGTHAEVECHQQVKLALGRLVVPDHLGRLGIEPGAGPPQAGFSPSGGMGVHFLAEVLALHAVAGAQQMLEEVLVALAAGAQDVGAPDKHVAWPVVRVVGVGAAEFERTVLQSLDGVVLGFQPSGGGVAHHLHRVRLQLRC